MTRITTITERSSAMECDYAVAPGLYAQELLDEKLVTRETFLDGLGFSDSELSAFLVGNLELTASLAGALAEITPIPAAAWVQLEEFYRSELERLSEVKAKGHSIIPHNC